MRGRRPIPTHLKLIRGNPGKRPIRPEPEPAVPEEMPMQPSFLASAAVDEWWKSGIELYRLGLLTALDVAPFAAYCQACARWQQAEQALARVAEKDPVTGGILVKRIGGDAGQNPLWQAARSAAAHMMLLAAHFGLTPMARARIAAGGYEPPPGGKFDGLIG
jgi:P27 family predicted phage terminase small subunit